MEKSLKTNRKMDINGILTIKWFGFFFSIKFCWVLVWGFFGGVVFCGGLFCVGGIFLVVGGCFFK